MSLKVRFVSLKNRADQTLRQVVSWAETLYGALVTKRKWFAVASAAVVDYWNKRMYYYTGYFTYNAFLGMLALMVALAAMIGFLSNTSFKESILSGVKNVAPVLGGGSSQDILDKLATYRSVTGIISVLALLWTGSKIFSAIDWGFGIILGQKGRSYARKRLAGFLFVLVVGTLFLAAFALQFGLAALWGWLFGETGTMIDIVKFLFTPIGAFLINFLMFLIIYRFVPLKKQRLIHCAIGAAVAAALFLGLQYLLDLYYGSISSIPSVYGSLATVIVLIVWLHVTGMIIFLGEEIVFVLGDERMVEEHREVASSWKISTLLWPEGDGAGPSGQARGGHSSS